MDEDEVTGGDIAREDVVDALEDLDNDGALMLLSEYFYQLNGKEATILNKIKNAKKCAELVYKAKRYEEVNIWLDEIATEISDEYGPDSEEYMAFTEDEDLETLRMNASDRSLGDEEEEEDYDNDDE